MQKRIKFQKTLIVILFLITAILLVSLLVGKNQTVNVLIFSGNELSLTKTLGEQSESFSTIKMSKSDYEKFGGNLISDIKQVSSQKLKFEIPPRTPITTSMLTDSIIGGSFASSTPTNHTIFTIYDTSQSLPVGIQNGDIIDIYLYISDSGLDQTSTDANGIESNSKISNSVSLLLSDVLVANYTEGSLSLSVSQSEYNILYLAQRLGQFVVHLPGKMDVELCSVVHKNLEEEYNTTVQNIMKSATYKNSTEEDKKNMLYNQRKNYEYLLVSVPCLTENDKTNSVSQEMILEKLLKGEPLNADKLKTINKDDNKKQSTSSNENNENSTEEKNESSSLLDLLPKINTDSSEDNVPKETNENIESNTESIIENPEELVTE